MEIIVLKINQAGNKGECFTDIYLHATHDGAIANLKQWVAEQNTAMLSSDDEEISDDIDEYFATSEDTYQIYPQELLQ